MPLFRREPEALDPEVEQAFSFKHGRSASRMWSVPSASDPIFLMISFPHSNSSLYKQEDLLQVFCFPCLYGFQGRKKPCSTNSLSLCIVHAMLSLCLQRWVLGSLVITEVFPWLKVLILLRWRWFQSHFPTWSPATYSQLFLLSVSNDLFWTNCSATAALFKVTLEAIHGEASHSTY